MNTQCTLYEGCAHPSASVSALKARDEAAIICKGIAMGLLGCVVPGLGGLGLGSELRSHLQMVVGMELFAASVGAIICLLSIPVIILALRNRSTASAFAIGTATMFAGGILVALCSTG